MRNPHLLNAALMCFALSTLGAMVSSAQTFQTLVNFNGTNGSYGTSGSYPSTTIVQGADGNLYGVTNNGGANPTYDAGTLFEMTPSGVLNTLYNFCSLSNCADGANPVSLMQGTDGNFYGVTTVGGKGVSCVGNFAIPGCGTAFEITPTGSLTVLYNFCSLSNCVDGWNPGYLIQGKDGDFYGTTSTGGSNLNSPLCAIGAAKNGCGTIFQLTRSGILTTIYSFCSQTNCTDGIGPVGIVQGIDGNFYGTTMAGGNTQNQTTSGSGTVFQITPAGTLTTLYTFGTPADGTAMPNGQLLQGSDGNFYGTTLGGDVRGCVNASCGVVYQISPSGALSVVHRFCSLTSCVDGNSPNSLMLGADGNFYGTTYSGGKLSGPCVEGCGTFFQLTQTGTLTTFYDFCASTATCKDGANPQAAVVQLKNDTFYGTTALGGGSNLGTIFSWSPNVALAPTFTPATVSFANQAVNTTSSSRGVTIKNVNTGTATLDLSNIRVSGPFAISSNTCAAMLLAGRGCTVRITFTPTTIGPVNGTLSVSDNAPGSPQTVPLSGTGVAQATVTPTSLAFGTVKVGTTSVAKKVTLRNNLSTTLTNISYSTAAPFAVSASTCTTALASKQSCTIGVTFSPTTIGPASSTLTVTDSANNSPQTVSLSGTGD